MQRNGAKEIENVLCDSPQLSDEEKRYNMTSSPLFLMEYLPHGLHDKRDAPLAENIGLIWGCDF